MSRTVPIQKPGKSEQSVSTPWTLIKAIEYRFGKLEWDLAASHSNAKCPNYITQGNPPINYDEWASQHNVLYQDSLKVDWHKFDQQPCWLNPPFGDIAPWARKCYEESQKGAKIFLLTPLTCSKWHREWIFGKAYILQLAERVQFEGHPTCYPKDLQIAWFNSGIRGTEIWSWKTTLKKHENPETAV